MSRLEKDENIGLDINKHRKLLGVKKNMDPTISKYTTTILNVFDLVNRKVRDQTQSSNAEKERLTQISQLQKSNAALEKEVQQLRDEIAKNLKASQKQPNVEAEWTKLLTILDEAFKKREANDPLSQG